MVGCRLCRPARPELTLPLVVAALTGGISQAAVLFIASMYWATSLGTGPAWNTWQGTVIPRHIRPKFFAFRSKLCQVTTLAGFLLGGFALQGRHKYHMARKWQCSAILFGTAFVCRMISTICLMLQSEPFSHSGGNEIPVAERAMAPVFTWSFRTVAAFCRLHAGRRIHCRSVFCSLHAERTAFRVSPLCRC